MIVFTPNTIIKSTEVNANFTGLQDGTDINSSAITTAKIADGAVTSAKLSIGDQNSYVSTAQTTVSTSYVDLATVGPNVTVTVPASGKVYIGISVHIANSVSGNSSLVALDISGANTVAAADDSRYCLPMQASGNSYGQKGFGVIVTGLTPGSTTFTAKYRVSAGTGTFRQRQLTVIPIA